MANEARVYAEGSNNCVVRYFTVANANALAKGALLEMSDDRTGITHAAGVLGVPLGFIVEEKEASDGKTTIGCQRTGVVEAYADNTILCGDVLMPAATANRVRAIPGGSMTISAGITGLLGRALESALAGEKVKVALCLG